MGKSSVFDDLNEVLVNICFKNQTIFNKINFEYAKEKAASFFK